MADERAETNREMWDELASIHPETDFYDVSGFLAGESTLHEPERDHLGDVAGESLVHLQCHIGLDTLSWAREGADAVGVDFAPEAVAAARGIAEQAAVDAEFVCCSVDEAPETLDREFDVVFTSYGALVWLPDIEAWARTVAALLRPGGRLCLAEFHPVTDVFDVAFEPERSYFDGGARRFEGTGSYADPDAATDQNVSYEWTHGLGEVCTALVNAGLSIERVSEYPYTFFERFEGMVRDDRGRYRIGDGRPEIPLVYAISANEPRRDRKQR
ncbi:class I SAM-dependent methyltransferase [Halococcus salsus]|uniref:class I SAM-dependent methyltransferase n=1 Tax=Halococcus salsus TaxID=2162894 RepID=UPI001357960A|nr:class I SAM-dependent methyltransferase [Halococcus salsus]